MFDIFPICLLFHSCFVPFPFGWKQALKNARIYQIFNDCICFIFITILLSMSFQATDLPNFIAASNRCGTDFSGYLSSYQCRDFSILPQQVKCQGYACSHSKEAICSNCYVFGSLNVVAVVTRRATKTS